MGAFKNLALHQYRTKENDTVKRELLAAGIPFVELPAYMNSEVKTSYIGLLNGFIFTRSWSSWVCSGDVPFSYAKQIHQTMNAIGVVATNCYGGEEKEPIGYCPIQKQREAALLEEMNASGKSTSEVIAALEALQKEIDPAWPRFVEGYNINTSEGLSAFAASVFPREEG